MVAMRFGATGVYSRKRPSHNIEIGAIGQNPAGHSPPPTSLCQNGWNMVAIRFGATGVYSRKRPSLNIEIGAVVRPLSQSESFADDLLHTPYRHNLLGNLRQLMRVTHH